MSQLPAIQSPGSPLALGVDETSLYEAFLSGRTPQTRQAYSQDFAVFAAFLGASSAAAALETLITISHGEANSLVLRYRSHLVEKGLAPASINRRLSAIRSAAKLARTLGKSAWMPGIDNLKAQTFRDTLGPGLEGTRAMLEKSRDQKPVKALRDGALIRLFFDLALSRGEVANLDVTDVEVERRRVWVKGKGKSQKQPITLPEKTLAAVVAWINVRADITPASETALFVCLSDPALGHRITGRGLHHVISALGLDVGIKTRPHGLRHASVTEALDRNGGDVRAVQQHARHADPRTTIKYDDNRRDVAGRVAASLADVL